MARKTVLVCDNCGREVGEGKGATLRLNYTDARRGSKQADLCDDCAGQMPGQRGCAERPQAEVGFRRQLAQLVSRTFRPRSEAPAGTVRTAGLR